MKNIKLSIAYDGTDFSGWQIQHNAMTIQQKITKALEIVCKHKIVLYASGRTDAGVHAKEQIANFHTDINIPLEKLPIALNGILPETIRVYKAEEVASDFHAQFSALSKTYRYTIDNGKYPDIFKARFAHHQRRKLDMNLMLEGAKYLVGKHEFSSFCAAHGSSKTFERTITAFEIWQTEQFITLEVSADGFLYHMVRNLAGLLIEIGEGKISPAETKNILLARDRNVAPATAPAKGLCLWKVYY